ncbi:hypothetical protein J2127_001074 [Methanococcus voltae]|uniref:hypothetical protein n=1 Tax=Methanococcus voltae TaxID=2188 RepID=UPI001AE826AC|nr:hypothetical protein [Methanococcus voltae]MBP2143905.1 hypothetical protein [Methanococcus voltae]
MYKEEKRKSSNGWIMSIGIGVISTIAFCYLLSIIVGALYPVAESATIGHPVLFQILTNLKSMVTLILGVLIGVPVVWVFGKIVKIFF